MRGHNRGTEPRGIYDNRNVMGREGRGGRETEVNARPKGVI